MRSLSQLRSAEQATLETAGLREPPAPRHADPGNQDWRPIVVKVKLAGGNAGNLTTPCTFTYDVWRAETPDAVISAPTAAQITTFRLATAVTPERSRATTGRYVAAPTASRGEAFFDSAAGTWVLLIAFKEIEAAAGCNA